VNKNGVNDVGKCNFATELSIDLQEKVQQYPLQIWWTSEHIKTNKKCIMQFICCTTQHTSLPCNC